MPLPTVIRPATVADCDEIYHAHLYAVRYTCASTYNDTILNAWSVLLSPESYLETMTLPHKVLWVIEYKGHVQGFFQLDTQEAQLDALYVHPFVFKQGLGTALLQRAEKVAFDAGLGFVKLYASLNSVPFYELNDYQALGDAELYLNEQVTVQCQLMRKHLDIHG